jgi:hypothetical protein
MSEQTHYLGQIIWYESTVGGTFAAVITRLHGPPNTHFVDLQTFGMGGEIEEMVPFGTDKGHWRFPEIPK